MSTVSWIELFDDFDRKVFYEKLEQSPSYKEIIHELNRKVRSYYLEKQDTTYKEVATTSVRYYFDIIVDVVSAVRRISCSSKERDRLLSKNGLRDNDPREHLGRAMLRFILELDLPVFSSRVVSAQTLEASTYLAWNWGEEVGNERLQVLVSDLSGSLLYKIH